MEEAQGCQVSYLNSLQLIYAKKLIKTHVWFQSLGTFYCSRLFSSECWRSLQITCKNLQFKKKKYWTNQLCDFGHSYHSVPQFALLSKYLLAPTQALKIQVPGELLHYLQQRRTRNNLNVQNRLLDVHIHYVGKKSLFK